MEFASGFPYIVPTDSLVTITFAIVEDQAEMRASLVEWLGNVPGLRCVGAYSTGGSRLEADPW